MNEYIILICHLASRRWNFKYTQKSAQALKYLFQDLRGSDFIGSPCRNVSIVFYIEFDRVWGECASVKISINVFEGDEIFVNRFRNEFFVMDYSFGI